MPWMESTGLAAFLAPLTIPHHVEGANLPATALRRHDFRCWCGWIRTGSFQPGKGQGGYRFSIWRRLLPWRMKVDDYRTSAGIASIWVRIPKIKKGNTGAELKMFWGQVIVPGQVSGSTVFNDSNSYLSVWHGLQYREGTGQARPRQKDTGTTVAGMIGKTVISEGGRDVGSVATIQRFQSPYLGSMVQGQATAMRLSRHWGNEAAHKGKVTMNLPATTRRYGCCTTAPGCRW